MTGTHEQPGEERENLRLLREVDQVFNSRDHAVATGRYEELVARAEQEQDAEVLTQALAMAARGHLIQDDADGGRPWLERAAQHATPDEPQGYSRYLGVRGRFEWKAGDTAQATATFRQMYDYCLEHDLHSRAIDAAHMVAITGSPEEQIEWAHKGIQAAELGGQEGWLGPLWNNLGSTWSDRGAAAEEDEARSCYREALDCYLKAREYHWKLGTETNKLIADWAVGSAYRRAGDTARAAAWLRPVLAWAERRYELDPTPENGEWVGWSTHDLGLLAADAGDTGRALGMLTRARELLDGAGIQAWDPGAWSALGARIAQLEEATG